VVTCVCFFVSDSRALQYSDNQSAADRGSSLAEGQRRAV